MRMSNSGDAWFRNECKNYSVANKTSFTETLFSYSKKKRPADLAFCISMGHSIYVLYHVERQVKDYNEFNWKVVYVLCNNDFAI